MGRWDDGGYEETEREYEQAGSHARDTGHGSGEVP
jgi:hypothetical protein